MIIASLFLWSGVLHLLLMMVNGAKNGFEATFRVVSYGIGAYVFLMVLLWRDHFRPLDVVLAIIGLKEAQGRPGKPRLPCCFRLSCAALS